MAVPPKLLTPWLPLIMSGITTLLLTRLGLVASLEPLTQHFLFKVRGSQPWNEEIVLIKIDEASIKALGWFPWQRDRYAQLIQQLTAADVETIAFNILFSEATAEDQALAQAMEDHGQVLLASAWYKQQTPLMPHPRLGHQAAAIGHMTQVSNALPATVEPYIDEQPALAIATAQVHQLGQGELKLLAVDRPLLPHWPGPVEELQQYSFIDILEERIPKAALRGKIALIGMTAEGFDPLISPIEPSQPASGIHLHAAVLHSYLQQNFLHRPAGNWGILSFLLWGVVLRYGLSRLAERQQLLTLTIGILVWTIVAIVALRANILLPISIPLLLLISTGFSLLLINNIQLQSANRKLQNKATTDALTGLKNRSFFNDHYAYLWQSCSRKKQSLGLIICDVDHFKQYNDTYGHLMGDKCLHRVAQNLKKSLDRSSDIVARYGGEEFVILLPGVTLDQGCDIIERIQYQLSQQAIAHKNSSNSSYITLSFGMACITPTQNQDSDLLIEQADKALYRAKQQGRNCYRAQQL